MPASINVYLTVQILSYATGSVVFVMLLGYLRKVQRLGGWTTYGFVAVVLGLVWNVGILINRSAGLMTGNNTLPVIFLCAALAHSALVWLPTVLWLDQGTVRWRAKWYFWLQYWVSFLSAISAGLFTVGYLLGIIGPIFRAWGNWLLEATAYSLVLHVLLGWILFQGRPHQPPRELISTRIVMALGLIMAMSLWFRAQPSVSPEWTLAVRTVAEQSTIVGIIVLFSFLAQFRFADVFVKWCLTILAAEIVALVAVMVVFDLLKPHIRKLVMFPKAGISITAVFVVAGLLLVFPRISRFIDRAADRWLFHRPDYGELFKEFTLKSASALTQMEIFKIAETTVSRALGIESVRIVLLHKPPGFCSEIDLGAEKVVTLWPGHPLQRAFDGLDPEVIVPMWVGDKLHSVMGLAAGERRRQLLSDEISFLTTIAERLSRRLEQLKFDEDRRRQHLQETHLQQLLMEAEIRALRAQVNPHFLFNTLNTIADLIADEPEKAELMTERLAEVFRYCLTQASQPTISLGKEFDFIRAYLEIEQVRFGSRLRVILELNPSLAYFPIPSLLLQPLVENAVKHGLAPKTGPISLCVRAQDNRDSIRLLVEDNGVGQYSAAEFFSGERSSMRSESSGVGLQLVTERLRALYGESAWLSVETKAGTGTRITVTIPNRVKAEV
ncbi:MAG: histidine kinase [Acidobacteria bacterium]|nr:histidine kinase [Acidobacteriota bacterium]